MQLKALETPRFIRKTVLGENQYHKNFHKIDVDTINVITSDEADEVTPLMSKIYLRLFNAPANYFEREGVLRFGAEIREGKQIKAWNILCELVGVASATANKALTWMHEKGIIGYFAGKNGVGIRVFLNRASSSIGTRHTQEKRSFVQRPQKILTFAPVSPVERAASSGETAFNESFALREVSDEDFSSSAPKNGADKNLVYKSIPNPNPALGHHQTEPSEYQTWGHTEGSFSYDEVAERIANVMEPRLNMLAEKAAASASAREMERTRIWFESKALPKAIRVAQSECYNILRKNGSVDERSRRTKADLEVGRYTPSEQVMEKPRPRTEREIRELAETCLMMLELQGQSIDVTLSEISAEAGGWLLPEDAPKVRELALELLNLKEGRFT